MTTNIATRILMTIAAAVLLAVFMSFPVKAFAQASKKQNLPPSMHTLVKKFPQIRDFGPDLADQAIQNRSVLSSSQMKKEESPAPNELSLLARSNDASREADDVAGTPWSQSFFPGLAVSGQWTSIPGVLKHLPVTVLYQKMKTSLSKVSPEISVSSVSTVSFNAASAMSNNDWAAFAASKQKQQRWYWTDFYRIQVVK